MSSGSMRIYCETYGCTSNRVDAEIIRGLLASHGHEFVDSLAEADIAVVNTCAVKGTTYRRMLRRLEELKRLKPVIVAGCLPLIDLKAVEELGEFSAIIGCRSLAQFPEALELITRGRAGLKFLDPGSEEKPSMCKKRFSPVVAAIPIAEGCLSSCAYCSVKFARGRLRSFSMRAIVEEARRLIDEGYREIQLTAQDTAAYGLDTGTRLPDLIREVASLPGDFRIRVGMMNPHHAATILDDLLEVFQHARVYKFLHLPVQSGSNRVLSLMRRGYSVETFVEIVEAFRKKIPDLYLCTDVIVGFPGEAEEDFEMTKELILQTRPDKVNISRFHPMPGTEAARMPQLNGRVIARRSRELAQLCRKIGLEINQRYLGRVMSGFAVEAGERGGFIVRSENYKQVILRQAELGEFYRAKIVEAFPTYLMGEPAE